MSPRQRRSRRPSSLSRNAERVADAAAGQSRGAGRADEAPIAGARRGRGTGHGRRTFVLAPKVCAACGPATAEILARISERVPDPARQDELKGQAERLNPDTWVTEEEVRLGLEQYESVLDALRASSARAAAGAADPAGRATVRSSRLRPACHPTPTAPNAVPPRVPEDVDAEDEEPV